MAKKPGVSVPCLKQLFLRSLGSFRGDPGKAQDLGPQFGNWFCLQDLKQRSHLFELQFSYVISGNADDSASQLDGQ